MPRKDGDKINIQANYAETKNLQPYGQQVQATQTQAIGKLIPKAEITVGIAIGLLYGLGKPKLSLQI